MVIAAIVIVGIIVVFCLVGWLCPYCEINEFLFFFMIGVSVCVSVALGAYVFHTRYADGPPQQAPVTQVDMGDGDARTPPN